MRDIRFGGIDPIILLNRKYKTDLRGVRGINPLLHSLDLTSNSTPQMLDFTMKMEIPWRNVPKRLVIIGCGGTGSHFLPNILQYLWSQHKSTGVEIPEIVLVDGDQVESKNLVRQRFTSTDLEMNKAAALARRYSSVFGFKISVLEGFLSTSDQLLAIAPQDRFNIIVGAVDNHRARMVIWDYVNKYAFNYGTAWIDAGNESWHGQVILGLKLNDRLLRGTGSIWTNAKLGELIQPIQTPNFFDEYPEEFMRIGGTPPVPQNNCAIMVEQDPQTIQANMMSAFCATSLTIQVLSGKVGTTQLNFDAQSGNTKARFLTKMNIAEDLTKIASSQIKIKDFLEGLDIHNTGAAEKAFPWLTNIEE